MQKIIYHLHDVCCKHSSLTLDDAVEYALKYKYKELYFTEHNPISVKCDYQVRRAPYIDLVNLKKRINEYNKKLGKKLHIYFGYEMEFNKPNRWYFERLTRDPLCDFAILGCHFFGDLFKDKLPLFYTKTHTFSVNQIKEFLELNEAGIKSGLFSWLPHPEIFLNSYAKWDKHAINACKKIIKWAQQYHLPLGFNVNFKKDEKTDFHYPSVYFWKLVSKTNIPVIIESDAHCLEKMSVEWLEQAKQIALSYGLKHNLVDRIPINWLPKKPLMLLYEKDLISYLNTNILENFKKQKIVFKEIDEKTIFSKLFQETKIHPVWTIVLTKNYKIIKKLSKTSAFIISDKKTDLSLNQFKNSTYKKFLTYFVKPQ